MNPFIRYQHAKHDLYQIEVKVNEFNKLFDKAVSQLNIVKNDIINPHEVVDQLAELKSKIKQLDTQLDNLVRFARPKRQERSNPAAYGYYGTINGYVQQLKAKLAQLDKHSDYLIETNKKSRSTTSTVVHTLAELQGHHQDLSKAGLGTYADLLVMATMIASLIGMFLSGKKKEE